MRKKVRIIDIAELTGVSIATVSHVINHTRYVSPEIVEKVEKCIQETGYMQKVEERTKNIRMGKGACIVGIFPTWNSVIYQKMMEKLREISEKEGYSIIK